MTRHAGSFLLAIASLRWSRAVFAAPFAYIADQGSNTVSVLDTATNAITATVGVGSQPWGVAVSHDGRRAYIANVASNTVSVIDTTTNTVVATVPVGGLGIAVNPTDTTVYVANGGVSVIDATTNTVAGTVGGFSYTEGVAVHPNGSRVYVTGSCTGGNGGGNFAVIDTGSNAVIACFYGGVQATHGLAVHPDGSRVFVAGGPSDVGVSIIDTATNAVVGTISTGGGGCSDVAVHPDGREIYGACRDPENPLGSIVTMDLASNAIVARAPVCLYPGGLAVDPEGAQVFAANTGCDALWVIDTVSNAVRHILPLPSAIALRGLAIGPTATMVTSTSTTLPEDTGFIPPDAATSRCEDVFLKNAARLSGVIFKCHLKAADAAFRALPFDEEGCESAAKSKYNGTNAKLFASGGCPLCAQSNAPGLRAQLESALDETNGLVYCAGSVPLP